MSVNPVPTTFAVVLLALFAGNITYTLIVRDVNQTRDSWEKVGHFERRRFIEDLELHKQAFPSSKKRLVLWLVIGVVPMGLAVAFFH